MSEELYFPKKGDHPFKIMGKATNLTTCCSLAWFKQVNINDSYFAEAYKNSADKIIYELEKNEDNQHPDSYFMPITFLYRHCLELKLKQLIFLCQQLNVLSNDDKIKKILNDHKLYPLWNIVKDGLVKVWPQGPNEDLIAVEGVIAQFHQIDKNGQTLRYSEDKNSNKTVRNFPDSVDLTHMMIIVNSTYTFLDACEIGLDAEIDAKNEMLCLLT